MEHRQVLKALGKGYWVLDRVLVWDMSLQAQSMELAVPRPRVVQCPRGQVGQCLVPEEEEQCMAPEGRAYQGMGTALPCLVPMTLKTQSPTDLGAPQQLGHRRAGATLGRACLVWNMALWGQGLALLQPNKAPQAVDMRVQRVGTALGVLEVAQPGTFLGALLQKAQWRVLRLVGVQPAAKAGRSGYSMGWSRARPGGPGWTWSCSQQRFWQ